MPRAPRSLLVAALLAATGGGASVRASGPGLCGLTRVTDHLLDCRMREQAPAAQTQSPSGASSGASSSSVARTGPVIRTATVAQYVPDTAIVRFAHSTTAQ